jgi:hypothetical protein
MRKTLLIALFSAAVLPSGARADTLALPAGASAPASHVPAKGESMSGVTKEFGAPKEKHATVGGDAPKHPPITRWDYDGFTVVFERSKVVDVVIAGAPASVQRVDELKPAP